jgi:Uncharacterised nucleotidyltransferase
MINSNFPQDYLKFSDEKILLLKSALLSGEEFSNSWKLYVSNFNLEKTDPVCVKLFPLLYVNLRKNKIETPLLGEFKKLYNITWYKNELLFNKILSAIKALAEIGIESIPLKGMALTLGFYKDFGLRPMNDFDLLVPEDKIMRSVKILLNLGYFPQNNFRFQKGFLQISNSYTFYGKDGGEFDLHWHVLYEACSRETDEILLQNYIPIKVNNKIINVLSVENQLLHVMVHGIDHFSSSGFQWLPDVIFLLQNYADKINWDKLLANSEKLKLSLSLSTGFKFINSEIKPLIPEWVLNELNTINISRTEKKEFRLKIKGGGRKGHVHLLWFHYLRHKGLRKFPIFPHYFLIFLQHKWSVKKIWMVPVYSIYIGINKLLNLSSD